MTSATPREGKSMKADEERSQDLIVVVHNEDDGSVAEIHAGPGTPVRVVLDRAYREFGIEAQAGDRIRCESGQDLAPHLDLKLRDFVDEVGCSLTWLFAGDQGGA